MPERPKEIKEKILKYTQNEVPHFFKYAKDKEEWQIAEINQSFVNKLERLIPSPRISCKYLDEKGKSHRLPKPDYKLMMTNPDIKVTVIKSKSGRLLEGTNPVIYKYVELAQTYNQKINAMSNKNSVPRDALNKSQIRKDLLYGTIIKEVKNELSNLGYSEEEIADILVKYLYGIKDSKYKDLLWTCYGDILYKNLERNVKPSTKEIQCIDCGEWFEVGKYDSATCRCKECQKEYRKIYKAEKERERRKQMRGQTL